MRRRISAASLLAPLAVIQLACSTGDQNGTGMSEEELAMTAREIHSRITTIDTHDDIPPDFATAEVDPGVRGDRQVDIPKMIEGGLDVAFFIVYVAQGERTPSGYELAHNAALNKFAAIHRMAEDMYPDRISLGYTTDAVDRMVADGKLVACIGVENGFSIGKDIGLLERYYELGARYMTLTHNGHNDIGDSANPRADLGDAESEYGGLSAFGEEVIAEMNRLGIMVDVSHTSKQTMLDAVRLSRAPVIASHSSTRALTDVPRNLDDEQLLALKGKGGVVQIVAVGSFVKDEVPEKRQAIAALREEMGVTGYRAMRALSEEQRAEYRRRRDEIDQRWPPATLQDFVNHIDHAVDLIGVDHVGISSDFDGGGGVVGWRDASETPNVTMELFRRGYSESEIRKLWGGNFLRVWREVERTAAEMQAGDAAS